MTATTPRERQCACGGTYLDTGRAWGAHTRTARHQAHEDRFEQAGQVPVNEPAVFRGYPTTYAPAEGVHVGRPPCANCGAAWRLHVEGGPRVGIRTAALCPTPAAATHDLPGAVTALAAAYDRHDQAAMFAARGEVQRYLPHKPGACYPLCRACDLLMRTA